MHWRPDQVKQTLIPILGQRKQTLIENKLAESFSLRERSNNLLERTKNGIEMAIEANEQTGINLLYLLKSGIE